MGKLQITSAVAAVIVSSPGMTEPFDPTAPDAAEIIREAYLNTPALPDGIAFAENARILSFLAAEDFEGTVAYFAEESGLSSEDAERVVRLSIRAKANIDVETKRENRRIGCTNSGQARLYGAEVYKVFEQMDDLREMIAQKHLEAVKAELGDEAKALFQQWLDICKPDTQYVKLDFKKAYERSGKSADAVLAGICASL